MMAMLTRRNQIRRRFPRAFPARPYRSSTHKRAERGPGWEKRTAATKLPKSRKIFVRGSRRWTGLSLSRYRNRFMAAQEWIGGLVDWWTGGFGQAADKFVEGQGGDAEAVGDLDGRGGRESQFLEARLVPE